MVPGALVAVVSLALVMLVLVLRERRRVTDALVATRAEAAELREQVASLAQRPQQTQRAESTTEFVITGMGSRDGRRTPSSTTEGVGSRDGRRTPSSTTGRGNERSSATDGLVPYQGRIDGKLFADIVLRESLLKAAAVAGGVRRALAP
ncbi:hypothetical protein, partial [Nocardioides sp.]|uniref:hypothetical protein n=1 Tax=Nocardioides sp. TaxID=35761 RepID=UPI0027376D18